MLVDWEELDEASHMSEVHVKGITAEEVEPVLVDELFVFHMAEGFVSQPISLKFSKDQKAQQRRKRREAKSLAAERAKAEHQERLQLEKSSVQIEADLPSVDKGFWT